MHPELGAPERLACGENLLPLRVDAFMHRQRQDLGEIEVTYVVAPVRARTIREHVGNVGYAIEMDVVQHHEPVISGRHNVLLEVVRSHGERERLGLHRVLGKMPGCAAMGNDNRPHKLLEVFHRTL